MKVESFSLDHTKVKAPFVRKCCVLTGEKGDVVSKYKVLEIKKTKHLSVACFPGH